MSEEKIEEKNESYWNKADIHTVFAIKNGCFDKVDIKRLEDKNYFYRLYSKVDWIAIIDFDKNDLIPLTKDILNRQNVFLEIKLLKIALFFLAFITLALSVALILIWGIKATNFDKEKTEILNEISTVSRIIQQKPIESPILTENIPKETRITPSIISNQTVEEIVPTVRKIDRGVKPNYPPVIQNSNTGIITPVDNGRMVPNYSTESSLSTPNNKRNIPNYAN